MTRTHLVRRIQVLALRTVLLLFLAAFAPWPAAAQAVTSPAGVVSGRITDATGLALVGAQVTLTPVGAGLTRLVLTGPEGRFEVVGLTAGRYTLTATAEGFERATREIMAGIGVAVTALALVSPVTAQTSTGILLLAHGGSAAWNANVTAIAAETNKTLPTEVALGMADRTALAQAIDRLKARGVKGIVAVPLFVSSYSSVLTSTEYLLGLRAEKPAAVEIFARMRHGSGAAGGHEVHQAAAAPQPPTLPIDAGIPVKMTSALDAHPIVRDIVVDRALSMSRTPEREAVILVAHGPNEEADDLKWRQSLAELSRSISQAVTFAHVEGLTVRDDAPAPVKQAATEALRAKVSGEIARGRRVLIVPVLLSYGGIEAGVRERLAGLAYEMSDKALAPDRRLVDWVLAKAREQ